MKTILVADDDVSILETLTLFLEGKGFRVIPAMDGEEVLAKARAEEPDLILLDIRMPRLDGLAALQALKEEVRSGAPVIMITALDDLENTVRAVQLGAYEFLPKPLDITKLEVTVRRALEAVAMRERVQWIAQREQKQFQLTSLVGHTPAMIEVFKQIGRIAASRVPVLITGESGTGKELVAKAIHFHSPQREEPFLAVNCAAAAAERLEAALFGQAAGDKTGGVSPGALQQAGGGTVFLDAVDGLALELQAKLARALADGEFQRVRSECAISLEARVIASSAHDLERWVETGVFREDLFYQLSVIRIQLPPLRERREDIPMLVEHLVDKLDQEMHRSVRGITQEALQALQAYDWPGNVRELENVLARAVALCRSDVLGSENLGFTLLARKGETAEAQPGESREKKMEGLLPSLAEMEAAHVRRMLEATHWNKKEAAARLGISRPTLDRKIRLYGLK